ncbi:hypothetical protein EV363DRAFT_1173743 [Boletus edulis]|nr:hypothetical protein EV363DRAFT_1173743 [Boletus edulis]
MIVTSKPVLTFSREVSHSFSTSISYRWLTIFKDRVHLGKERPLSSRYNVPNAFTVQTVDLCFHNVCCRPLHWPLLGYVGLLAEWQFLYSWSCRSQFFSHFTPRSPLMI